MTAFDREWTPEEEEALNEISRNLNGTVECMITNVGNGIFSGCSNMSSPSTPITLNDVQEMWDKVQFLTKETGIHITHIAQPEEGWPMAFYCPLCKATTFLHSPYATKPKEGDYLILKDICAEDAPIGLEHSMKLCLPKVEWAKKQ